MAIPRTDDGLRAFAANLLSLCDTNKTVWNITPEAITNVQTLNTAYYTALQVSESPNRRKADTVAKNEAKDALTDGLRVFIGKYLDYNDSITDPIRESLGLPIKDKTLTPVARPSASPVFYIKIQAARILEIHFKPEGEKGSARPKGYSGAVIRYGVLESQPASENDLLLSILATRSPHVFEFASEERDKKAYFAIAWQNQKGEMGPFSEIQTENVP